jgi:hypothetical protein
LEKIGLLKTLEHGEIRYFDESVDAFLIAWISIGGLKVLDAVCRFMTFVWNEVHDDPGRFKMRRNRASIQSPRQAKMAFSAHRSARPCHNHIRRLPSSESMTFLSGSIMIVTLFEGPGLKLSGFPVK